MPQQDRPAAKAGEQPQATADLRIGAEDVKNRGDIEGIAEPSRQYERDQDRRRFVIEMCALSKICAQRRSQILHRSERCTRRREADGLYEPGVERLRNEGIPVMPESSCRRKCPAHMSVETQFLGFRQTDCFQIPTGSRLA